MKTQDKKVKHTRKAKSIDVSVSKEKGLFCIGISITDDSTYLLLPFIVVEFRKVYWVAK